MQVLQNARALQFKQSRLNFCGIRSTVSSDMSGVNSRSWQATRLPPLNTPKDGSKSAAGTEVFQANQHFAIVCYRSFQSTISLPTALAYAEFGTFISAVSKMGLRRLLCLRG